MYATCVTIKLVVKTHYSYSFEWYVNIFVELVICSQEKTKHGMPTISKSYNQMMLNCIIKLPIDFIETVFFV